MVIVYILLFILILGIVVCFHEYGHYFFAKKAGILVNEFAFGMGPKLLSKKKGETYWSIRALPLGGFCAMSGEDPTDCPLKVGDEVKLILENGKVVKIIMKTDNPDYQDLPVVKIETIDIFGKDMSPLYINEYEVARDAELIFSKKETMQIAPEERNFYTKSVWQRFLVCFGGPLNNIIMSIVVFLILGCIAGVPNLKSNAIGEVSKDSPAEIAGLKKNDKIISINGYEISSYEDISDPIQNGNRELSVVVERDGSTIAIPVYAQYYLQNIGISSSMTAEDKNALEIVVESKAALAGSNKTKAYTEGGLRNGDILLSVSYKKENTNTYLEAISLTSWDQLFKIAKEDIDGGHVKFEYKRLNSDGVYETHTSDEISVYSNSLLESQNYVATAKQIGISCAMKFNLWQCLWNGLRNFWSAATVIFSTLGLLFTSKEVGVKDMGGFITILNQTASYASGGFESLLYWVGLLSINLGIVNLLPIPALDGGRIVFLFIEGITGKKIPAKVESIIINVVFWLLMAFIAYVLLQDVFRLVIQLKCVNLILI